MRNLVSCCLAVALLGACAGAVETAGLHESEIHEAHEHVHGDDCGHMKVWHVDHWDYLHDGHLHFVHEDHVDEHVLDVSDENPFAEAPLDTAMHDGHMHTDGDSDHPMVRHGDHFDFIHDGRLHYVHGDHIDDHGPVTVEANG